VSDLDHIQRWLRDVAAARAEVTRAVPGGMAVLHSEFPLAHDHNRLLVWSPVDAAALADAAEAVLADAGCEHRQVQVQVHALADVLDAGLTGGGYRRTDEVVMARQPDADDTLAQQPPAPAIVELALAERAAVATDDWHEEQPEGSAELTRQLGQRITTVLDAVDATFLAIRDDTGSVAARTDLYVRDGVAQIEEVMTTPAARNRGFASALVREATRRARLRGVDIVFLTADADDWPAQLYGRLGFTELGRSASFAR
jgi:ribosomal protein S18 acetylase RimI-like enzyme